MFSKAIYYIFTFFFFSAIGWAVESTYRSLGERRVINSGFLHGPVCPIYGTGVLVFEVLLVPISQPYGKRWWLVLLAGVIAADTVEYITSFLMEKLFHARWWDYTGNFLNINGRICFKHSCYWAIAAYIYCYIVSPLYSVVGGFVPQIAKTVAVICILVIFSFDLFLTVKAAIDVQKINRTLDEIGQILSFGGELIKTGAEELYGSAEYKVEEIKKTADEVAENAEARYKEFKETIEALRTGEKITGPQREANRLLHNYDTLRKKVTDRMDNIEKVLGLSSEPEENKSDEETPEATEDKR